MPKRPAREQDGGHGKFNVAGGTCYTSGLPLRLFSRSLTIPTSTQTNQPAMRKEPEMSAPLINSSPSPCFFDNNHHSGHGAGAPYAIDQTLITSSTPKVKHKLSQTAQYVISPRPFDLIVSGQPVWQIQPGQPEVLWQVLQMT
jgi:hypothetical protein